MPREAEPGHGEAVRDLVRPSKLVWFLEENVVPEPEPLTRARQHLAAVEADPMSENSLSRLAAGLALLDALHGTANEPTAENLTHTYAAKLKTLIDSRLVPEDVPEPELLHLMKLSQRVGEYSDTTELTARVARRFIDAAFEGYSDEEKSRAIEALWARIDSA